MLNDHGISGHVFLISGHVFLISGHVGPHNYYHTYVIFHTCGKEDLFTAKCGLALPWICMATMLGKSSKKNTVSQMVVVQDGKFHPMGSPSVKKSPEQKKNQSFQKNIRLPFLLDRKNMSKNPDPSEIYL